MSEKKRATIVFFSIEALGHIQPILSIAKELRARGHQALIVTLHPLSLAAKLAGDGFQLHHCISPDSSQRPDSAPAPADSQQKLQAVFEPVFQNFRLGAERSFEATYAIGGVVNKYLDDITQHHQLIADKLASLKPDLIVIDHVVGVPCATSAARRWVRLHSAFPSVLYSAINDNYAAGVGLPANGRLKPEQKEFERRVKSQVCAASRRLWRQLGYPDWPLELELLPSSPHLNFYLGPQELGLEKVAALKPLPSELWFRLEHTIDSDGLAKSKRFQVPEKLRQLPGKLIYFSLGTLVSSDLRLMSRLLEILAKSPNRFIVSMGQMHQHVKLYPNMYGQSFLDQMAVLPEVDLFITHGGHNSIIETFYFGVPVIVLPVFADQFDSAQRIEDCDFGKQLRPYDCTEDQLLGAIDTMLANDSLRERMRAVSSRLKSINYPKIAADKLEEVLRS